MSPDKKALRKWTMCISGERASAKALRKKQAWSVARNSKEAAVATAERARGKWEEMCLERSNWVRSYRVL